MSALMKPTRPRAAKRGQAEPAAPTDPIVAAVDASPANRATIDAAVGLAAELEAPLVFV
jgi:hypothetical protein